MPSSSRINPPILVWRTSPTRTCGLRWRKSLMLVSAARLTVQVQPLKPSLQCLRIKLPVHGGRKSSINMSSHPFPTSLSKTLSLTKKGLNWLLTSINTSTLQVPLIPLGVSSNSSTSNRVPTSWSSPWKRNSLVSLNCSKWGASTLTLLSKSALCYALSFPHTTE